MKKLRCDDMDSRLQDFIDGVLEPAEERRMREHLAACEICRREESELRRLLTRVAELPRSIAPPRDLWPGVADRLRERPAGSREESDDGRLVFGPWGRRTARQWAWQAAAALIFMVLGGVLSQLVDPALPGARSAGGTGSPAAGGAVAASARPGVDLAAVEAEYLRAKEALWLLVYSRYDELSPVKLEIVQKNLVILDDAIRDLRDALSEDPGNRQLETSLLSQHRRGIDLLQRLTAEGPSRSSRTVDGARS